MGDKVKKKLYIIPTPIGNMDDITIRAIKVIAEVDVLLAEDTRVAKKLLDFHNISKKIISNHKFNEKSNLSKSIFENHQVIGLISDRGTPLISDPGYIFVNEAIERGYKVECLPGATALIPALVVSGLKTEPFLFYGFLDSKSSKRKMELKKLQNEENTLIFYESPHRILETLKDMKEIFGDRCVSVSREISKKYETTYRSSLFKIENEMDIVKGEYVIVVDGNNEVIDFSKIKIEEHIQIYVENGLSVKEAIKKVAKERGLAKGVVYNKYHRNGDE